MAKIRVYWVLLTSMVLVSFSIFGNINYPILPSHFPRPIYDFQKNPLDSQTVELGRKLFYDPILSVNNQVSCATCHSPFNAFAHTDHEVSHGIFDSIGTRNAPGLFNLAWQNKFMWDGAINRLDAQALAPINHPSEMGSNTKDLMIKLNKSQKYKSLFFRAFGDSIISTNHFLKALTQFQLTLISANSKYDKVRLGQAKFTEQEQKGYRVFQRNCATCHIEPLFNNAEFRQNGLGIDSYYNDLGRAKVTGVSADALKFKVPSLRNLSYTYPYMHDGRFKSLNEVLKHYSKTLSVTATERVDIVAFLLTLNDSTFVFNKNHQFSQ